jgi:hypothetical protein
MKIANVKKLNGAFEKQLEVYEEEKINDDEEFKESLCMQTVDLKYPSYFIYTLVYFSLDFVK